MSPLDGGERLAEAGGRDEAVPLAQRQRDDHDAVAVAGEEVAAEGAVEVVAVLRRARGG